jgi:hypothetical protein
MLSTSNSRWPTPRGSTTVRCSGLRLKDASPSGDSTRYCSSRFPSIPRPAGTLPSLIIKARVNFCFCHRLQASLWWLLLCRSNDLRGAPCGKPGTSRNPFHPLAAARQPKFARCGRLLGIDRSEQSSPGPCVVCPPVRGGGGDRAADRQVRADESVPIRPLRLDISMPLPREPWLATFGGRPAVDSRDQVLSLSIHATMYVCGQNLGGFDGRAAPRRRRASLRV